MKTTTSTVSARVLPYVIEPLNAEDRARIVEHLVGLDGMDRGLRFGMASDDELIERYVAGIDFEADVVLAAAAADRSLIGVAHIALHGGIAELGISVSPCQREKGVAGALAAAALREAQRLGASQFRFASAATNGGMRRLARQLGMAIRTDGSELTAHRRLDGAGGAS